MRGLAAGTVGTSGVTVRNEEWGWRGRVGWKAELHKELVVW